MKTFLSIILLLASNIFAIEMTIDDYDSYELLQQRINDNLYDIDASFLENEDDVNGIYVLSEPLEIVNNQHEITLISISGCEMSGNNESNLITIYNSSNVKIEGIKFANGSSTGFGAAIKIDHNSICSFNNDSFLDNTLNFDSILGISKGGAIYCNNSTISVANCNFSNNISGHNAPIPTDIIYSHGGAICAENSTISITGIMNADFTNNSALEGSGGAIFLLNCSYDISNCEFVLNSSCFDGGAVKITADNYDWLPEIFLGTIENCDFSSNKAIYDGSDNDIYAFGGALSCGDWEPPLEGLLDHIIQIKYCNFQTNKADRGGAVSCGYTKITQNSNNGFTQNIAVNGGAIFSNGGTTIEGGFFENDSASFRGGAIFCENDHCHTDFYGVTFSNNKATEGGAICLVDAVLVADSCQFLSNRAINYGGAISCPFAKSQPIQLFISNSNFEDCAVTDEHSQGQIAGYGGAIYSVNFVNLDNSIFKDCFVGSHETTNGGAIYLKPLSGYNNWLYITNCLFDGCYISPESNNNPNSGYFIAADNGCTPASTLAVFKIYNSTFLGRNISTNFTDSSIQICSDSCPADSCFIMNCIFLDVTKPITVDCPGQEVDVVYNSYWYPFMEGFDPFLFEFQYDDPKLLTDGRLQYNSPCYDVGIPYYNIDEQRVSCDFDLTSIDIGWSPRYQINEISGNVSIAERGWYKTTGSTIISGVDTIIPEGTTILNEFGGNILIRDNNPINDYNIEIGDQSGARTALVGPSYCFGCPQNGQGDLTAVSFNGVLFSQYSSTVESSLWFQYCDLNINGYNNNVIFHNYENTGITFDEVCKGRFENFDFNETDEDGIANRLLSIFMYYSDVDINNVTFRPLPLPYSVKVSQYGTDPGPGVSHVISNCTFDCTDNSNETYPLFIAYSTVNLHHNTFNNIEMNSIYLSEATLNMRNGAMNEFYKPDHSAYNEYPMIDGIGSECDLSCGFNSFVYSALEEGDSFISVDATGDWEHNFWGQNCENGVDPEAFLPDGVDSTPWLEECPESDAFVPCDDQDEESELYNLGQEANELGNYQAAQAYWSQMMQDYPESKYCNDATGMIKVIGLLTEYGEENYGSIRSCLESAATASDSIDALLSVFQVCSAWCVEGRHGDREASVALLDSLLEEKKGNKDMENLINTAIAEIDSYPPQGQNNSLNPTTQITQLIRRQERLLALQGVLVQGFETMSAVSPETEAADLPHMLSIASCHPNPFNPITLIEVNVDDSIPLLLEIYNVIGQRVRTLHDGQVSSGLHRFSFNGNGLSSGLYFVRAQQGSQSDVKKVMLVQ